MKRASTVTSSSMSSGRSSSAGAAAAIGAAIDVPAKVEPLALMPLKSEPPSVESCLEGDVPLSAHANGRTLADLHTESCSWRT